jgi:hypothetical protein
MLQEEDASSEIDLGDDEEDAPQAKIPPLSLSSDSVLTTSHLLPEPSPRSSQNTDSQSISNIPPSSPRTRNNSHDPTTAQPPKLIARSQTEGQIRKDSSSSPPSPSPIRYSTPVSKLKDFAEKAESQSTLSRFEARMALMKAPPKYPAVSASVRATVRASVRASVEWA